MYFYFLGYGCAFFFYFCGLFLFLADEIKGEALLKYSETERLLSVGLKYALVVGKGPSESINQRYNFYYVPNDLRSYCHFLGLKSGDLNEARKRFHAKMVSAFDKMIELYLQKKQS